MKSEMSGVRQGVGLVVTSLLSTPLMMLQMATLQLVSLNIQGMPSIRSLVAVLIIYIGVIAHSWGNRKMERRSGSDGVFLFSSDFLFYHHVSASP